MTDQSLEPELAGAILTVDLNILQDNWRLLAERAGTAECAAVVKANAYGLGIEHAAPALAAAGCRTFFVALPAEGAALRAVLPKATIYILDGLFPGQAAYYARHQLRPALASFEEIEEWATYCTTQGRRLPAAVHVDTGINRLGLSAAELRRFAERHNLMRAIDITLVMSHLACADEPGNRMNQRQRQRFDDLRTLLPETPASLANSAAAFLGGDFAYQLVRPGVAVFGGNPFASRANPMRAVLHLHAPILQIRVVAPGEGVGYGALWRAERASRVGVLGVGYRDGLMRSLSYPAEAGPAHVFVGGQFAPIIGRLSMDLMTIDLTDVPEDFARRGTKVELMGHHVTVDDIARWSGTIPYEVLTSLGNRFSRIYLGYRNEGMDRGARRA